MNKYWKLILGGIITLIFAYFGHNIFNALWYKHHINYNNYKRGFWLFNDSIRKNIDTAFYYGLERETDSLYNYFISINNKEYAVSLWEFRYLEIRNMDDILFNKNVPLDKIKFSSGEEFNLNQDIRPEIKVKFDLSFNNSLNININEGSKVIKTLNSPTYRGFFGDINKISITNNKKEPLILFDYGMNYKQTLFLLYKKDASFYLILINSIQPFNESIIEILKLS